MTYTITIPVNEFSESKANKLASAWQANGCEAMVVVSGNTLSVVIRHAELTIAEGGGERLTVHSRPR